MSNTRVFISHSHRDRHTAVVLTEVLKSHGAETFLDQDQIEPGDALPERLQAAIRWCDRFLLLWSANAAQSDWVTREWKRALELSTRIIPYRLDQCPLPPGLADLVFVSADDRERADGQLLLAIFGPHFKPANSAQIFPGKWRADVGIAGLGNATYILELRANGQIIGQGQVGQSGLFGALAQQAGMGHLLNMPMTVGGNWKYEDLPQMLTLDLTVDGLGQRQHEVIQIRTTGKEQQALNGRDYVGRQWLFQRLP